jgi:signal transduction histidine kinase
MARGELEQKVEVERVEELGVMAQSFNQMAQQLRESFTALEKTNFELELRVEELKQTQLQLVQSEKMSTLGQLVAGVAHEINNPIGFIAGNLSFAQQYIQDIIKLVNLYQQYYPHPALEIRNQIELMELGYVVEDLPHLISSLKEGTDRIRNISTSLRTFSRTDLLNKVSVNLHEGLDSTLMILKHRLKANCNRPAIKVIKEYGSLPLVECYPGQLNQVFMNIMTNAIEAIDEYSKKRSLEDIKKRPGTIWICTQVLDTNQVIILIGDNGIGMTPDICNRLFDPFFTTKPVGQGTGLGMSISYQIVVVKHQGELQCISAPDQGTAFLISIPISQQKRCSLS